MKLIIAVLDKQKDKLKKRMDVGQKLIDNHLEKEKVLTKERFDEIKALFLKDKKEYYDFCFEYGKLLERN